MNISGYQGNFNPGASATIALGATDSNVLTLKGMSLVGIKIPAGLTGTALTFTMCDTVDGTYVPVKNSAGAVSYTVAVSNYYAIDPKDFQGIQFLKIKSGTTQATADAVLVCSLKGI